MRILNNVSDKVVLVTCRGRRCVRRSHRRELAGEESPQCAPAEHKAIRRYRPVAASIYQLWISPTVVDVAESAATRVHLLLEGELQPSGN